MKMKEIQEKSAEELVLLEEATRRECIRTIE